MSSVRDTSLVSQYPVGTVGATALAGGHGGEAPVLGPYKNISPHEVASEGSKCKARQGVTGGAAAASSDNSSRLSSTGYRVGDGRYRRQYEDFATSGAWGHEENTCGRMTLRRVEGSAVTIMPALCGCWGCGLCGVRRTAWLKAQLNAAVPMYNLRWFWTLTLSTHSCTAVESFELITHYWDRCHKGLIKSHGKFSYVWTVEATQQGYAHLHLLCSLAISNHKLHDRWHSATRGSWGAKVEPVRSDRAAKYLAKYCAKQATLRRQPGWEVLAGKRVFSKSRDIQFEPFKPMAEGDSEWSMVPRAYWDVAAELRSSGRVMFERTKGVPVLRVSEGEVAR